MAKIVIKNKKDDSIVVIHHFLTEQEARAFMLGFKAAHGWRNMSKFIIKIDGKEV